MADILLVQGEDPPFRLAAWVMREEGFIVRLTNAVGEASLQAGAAPPDLIVLNLFEDPVQHLQSVKMLRDTTVSIPILHLAPDGGHDLLACDCNFVLLPPHSGPALIEAVERLLP